MHFRHLAALLFAVIVLAVPAPVAADCQAPASIEEALAVTRIAFVGTVTASRENAPGAAFAVDEVWIGNVSSPAEIHGMFGDDQLAEDDRLFEAGARYLVIPYVDDDGLLHDHICTGTTEWRAELGELRPPDARVLGAEPSGAEPSGEEPSGGEPSGAAGQQAAAPRPPIGPLIAGAAALLLIGIALVTFRSAGRIRRT
jgi:hypothetical protein